MAITSKEVQAFLRVLDVLSDPTKAKAAAENFLQITAESNAKWQALVEKERDLEQREKVITTTLQEAARAEKHMQEQFQLITKQLKEINDRTEEITRQEQSMRMRDSDLQQRIDDVGKRHMALKLKEQAAEVLKKELDALKADLEHKHVVLDNKLAKIKALTE